MAYRSTLDLTPMIDVMMVLLMIFMIVQYLTPEIALPRAVNADVRPPKGTEIVLRVYRSGLYVIAEEDEWGSTSGWNPPRAMTTAELGRELERLYSRRVEDRVLYLKADTAVPFGVIEQAMVIARRAGVRVLAAVTQRRMR